MRIRTIRVVAVVLGLAVVVIGQTPAYATAPGNDTEANAIVIGEAPFTSSVDTSDAVADGPAFCGNLASVFYRFTPSSRAQVQIDTLGSDYDTTLGVYTRDASGAVVRVACNDDRLGSASGVRLRPEAGTTYYLIVGQCCGRASAGEQNTRGGGSLTLSVTRPSSEPLDFDVTIDPQGTVDGSTGMATIGATLTCTKRSQVYFEGTLRQLRNGMFVARAYIWGYLACTPDAPVVWSSEFDTDTSVAFGAGAAKVRITYEDAYAGWRDGLERYDGPTADVTLS